MIKYTFDRDAVIALLDHAFASETHRIHDDDPSTDKPGLWLVGEHGVYLISNGLPPLVTTAADHPQQIVYADQCNPVTMAFGTWWEAQKVGFGPENGTEFLDAHDMRRALFDPVVEKLLLEVTEDAIIYVTAQFRR